MSPGAATVAALTVDERSGALAGQRVVITGPLTGPLTGVRRVDALRLLREAGADAARAVSGRTAILVASRLRTRKSVRAEKLGVRVIAPGELAEMLGYPALW